MNFLLLYFLFVKATLTSFSGLASLPMVRDDFVLQRHLLTDHDLNMAVVAGRTGPGPYGIYLVGVGYKASGVSGAIAALLAVMTPAFLILPLMRWAAKRAHDRRVQGAIQGVLLGSAGLLISASIPLARDALTGPVAIIFVVVSFGLLTFTRIDSSWVMGGAVVAGMLARLAGAGL
jgi:chromate transporter